MIRKLRQYVETYGEARNWNMALKFQVLFQALQAWNKKGSIPAPETEIVHTVLYTLADIPNSGVVEEYSHLNDKQWEDTLTCRYSCGHYKIYFERSNDYSIRSGCCTDYSLKVTRE